MLGRTSDQPGWLERCNLLVLSCLVYHDQARPVQHLFLGSLGWRFERAHHHKPPVRDIQQWFRAKCNGLTRDWGEGPSGRVHCNASIEGPSDLLSDAQARKLVAFRRGD